MYTDTDNDLVEVECTIHSRLQTPRKLDSTGSSSFFFFFFVAETRWDLYPANRNEVAIKVSDYVDLPRNVAGFWRFSALSVKEIFTVAFTDEAVNLIEIPVAKFVLSLKFVVTFRLWSKRMKSTGCIICPSQIGYIQCFTYTR